MSLAVTSRTQVGGVTRRDHDVRIPGDTTGPDTERRGDTYRVDTVECRVWRYRTTERVIFNVRTHNVPVVDPFGGNQVIQLFNIFFPNGINFSTFEQVAISFCRTNLWAGIGKDSVVLYLGPLYPINKIKTNSPPTLSEIKSEIALLLSDGFPDDIKINNVLKKRYWNTSIESPSISNASYDYTNKSTITENVSTSFKFTEAFKNISSDNEAMALISGRYEIRIKKKLNAGWNPITPVEASYWVAGGKILLELLLLSNIGKALLVSSPRGFSLSNHKPDISEGIQKRIDSIDPNTDEPDDDC